MASHVITDEVFKTILDAKRNNPECDPVAYIQRKLKLPYAEAKNALLSILRSIKMNPRKVLKSDLEHCISKKQNKLKELNFEISVLTSLLEHIDDREGTDKHFTYHNLIEMISDGETKK